MATVQLRIQYVIISYVIMEAENYSVYANLAQQNWIVITVKEEATEYQVFEI